MPPLCGPGTPSLQDQPQRLEYPLRVHQFGDNGRYETRPDIVLPFRFRRDLAEESEYFHLPCARAVPGAFRHWGAAHSCRSEKGHSPGGRPEGGDRGGRMGADVHMHIEVVRLDNNALAVCMQSMDTLETTGRASRALHVTVLLLPSRVKKEITIPMNNASSAVVALSRVHFSCVGASHRARSRARGIQWADM